MARPACGGHRVGGRRYVESERESVHGALLQNRLDGMVCRDKLSVELPLVRSGTMPRRTKPDALALGIGRRIRVLRAELGLTLEQVAYTSELGSKGHLSSLEKGLVMPTVATLKAIADRLGVIVADLVTDPRDGDRAKLVELTRGLPPGVLRKLVRELSAAKRKK